MPGGAHDGLDVLPAVLCAVSVCLRFGFDSGAGPTGGASNFDHIRDYRADLYRRSHPIRLSTTENPYTQRITASPGRESNRLDKSAR